MSSWVHSLSEDKMRSLLLAYERYINSIRGEVKPVSIQEFFINRNEMGWCEYWQ